jgi:2-polyprenyl-6-hydroxyphenyl methylase/3-demethylubiquinone-9 3-methyltransferase
MNDAVHFHSQVAWRYESNYTKRAFVTRKNILHELLAADDLTGQNWLDAGCGTGTLARSLAAHKGCNVLGVDASEAMIFHCAPHPNTEFRQIGDICETGLADAAFDGVLCSSVLEYVSEPRAALVELRRVLRQNGLLLVSVPNSDPIAWCANVSAYWLTRHLGRWRLCQYLDYCKHRYSELHFRNLLDSCGFHVEAVRTYGGVRGFPILGHGSLMMFRAVKL